MLAAFKKGGEHAARPRADAPAATSRARRPSTIPPASSAAPKAEEPKQGLILRAIEWLGPSDAGAVPLPLLILAGVAFLLLAAAGGSLVNRRLQERRLPPPPQRLRPWPRRALSIRRPAVASRTRNDPE